MMGFNYVLDRFHHPAHKSQSFWTSFYSLRFWPQLFRLQFSEGPKLVLWMMTEGASEEFTRWSQDVEPHGTVLQNSSRFRRENEFPFFVSLHARPHTSEDPRGSAVRPWQPSQACGWVLGRV